jgi:penicillin-binding protein 2
VKFGWRVAALAFVFTGLFSVLFIRLWFVQLAAGQEYAIEAENNIISFDYTVAPRGNIVDRNDIPLATTNSRLIVFVDRAVLPEETENDVIQRLAALLDVPPLEVRSSLERSGSGTVAALLNFDIDADTAYTILEQRLFLPGVTVEALPVREYLQGDLMAHVLGHIGLPSANDLERLPNIDPNTVVGKLGIERQYDSFLQGNQGSIAYRVNAHGDILQELRSTSSVAGDTVILTLDVTIQAAVQAILPEVVELSNANKDTTRPADPAEWPQSTKRAAAIVMEVDTGAIVAMASYPTFEPQSFVGGIAVDTFADLSDNFAFNNLVIQGLKPPASTFKAVTYVTALEERIFPEGVNSAEESVECSAQLEADFVDQSKLVWQNWTFPHADGRQNLHDAFRRSCNIYFWEIALSIWRESRQNAELEDVLQEWARELGFGRKTQVDLPFENRGIMPDRALFEEWKTNQPWRVRKEGWLGGDLMNLAVGQGSVLATPIQVATAYAAMVNGGTVYQPRVVDRVESAAGEIVRLFEPRPLRTPDLNPGTVNQLRNDMAAVVATGTARRAFEELGALADQIGGKTGTAQGFTDNEGIVHDATAWFVGVAPINNPRWVVVVLVDEGGSGGAIAAPAVRAIFQHLLGQRVTPLAAGEETER